MEIKKLSLITFLTGALLGNSWLFAWAEQPVKQKTAASSESREASSKPKSPSVLPKDKYILGEPKIDVLPPKDALPPKEDAVTRLNRESAVPDTTRLSRPAALPKSESVPPVAPSFNPVSSAPKTAPPVPVKDKFPTVGQLETLMFGHANPTLTVDGRLDKLEIAVFQKAYSELDTETRIKRLREVIVGSAAEDFIERAAAAPAVSVPPPFSSVPPTPYGRPDYRPGETEDDVGAEAKQQAESQAENELSGPHFQNFDHIDLKQELSLSELEKFGLVVINDLRSQEGLDPLAWDDLAHKVACEHVTELASRNLVSHLNGKGENPDVRYTKAGGRDALEEGLILFTSANKLKPNRELVVKILEVMDGRQDDRESFFSRHATNFAFSLKWTDDHSRLVCCTEILTRRGEMEPVPLEANVGDKIEVKGSISDNYKFHKITLAWEGPINPMPDDGQEQDEAMPYFPPLDYEAHAAKSERDWEKGMRVLQIAGITAAIAGGFFIPPVALAAPLIAASAGVPKPKAVSEIPIKGGVKTDGTNFNHKVTLNNDDKEGIYYLTVWGIVGSEPEVVPLSRRAIIARKASSDADKKSEDDHYEKRKEEKGAGHAQ